jgi:DNA-directed RNA polymerase II subunit RPB2
MDPWDILDVYFRDHIYPFTKHHLDSFREFLRTHIPNTIQSYNPITMIKMDAAGNETLKVEVHVGGKDGKKVYVERPTILDHEGKPMILTPQQARLRNLTYAVHVYADVEIVYTQDGVELPMKMFPMTLVGSLPLMLHSDPCILHGQGSKVLRSFGECPMDPGGYFIVDGKEKVIVSQERITTNRLFVSKLDDPNFAYRGVIQCTGASGETALSPRTVEFHLVRRPDTLYDAAVKEDLRGAQGAILVSLPSIQGHVPLTTVFRALGMESDRQIIECICGEITQDREAFASFLRPSLAHGASTGIFTTDAALEVLRPRVYLQSIQQLKSVLALDLFPNLSGSLYEKACYLGYLVQQLMKTALGMQQVSDRDSYVFKRVDISGFLLAQLFQETYAKFRNHVRDSLDQEYYYKSYHTSGDVTQLIRHENLGRIFAHGLITDVFARSLKGMWGSVKDDPEQGLVQDLARISYIGFLSHLRRVNMPLDRSIKIVSPHRLHPQQWGIMCPFESPDGASIGYLKNFALMTQITFGTSVSNIMRCLDDLGLIPVVKIVPKQLASEDTVRVFVNGTLQGVVEDPITLTRALRVFRRTGILNPFVSLAWNIVEREIRIQTEPGRPCRPLLIVERGKARLDDLQGRPASWFDMVFGSFLPKEERSAKAYYKDEYISVYTRPEFEGKSMHEIIALLEPQQSCIEYLDIEEENTMLLAMQPQDVQPFTTHLEIHPSTAFSVVTHIVPFANHNAAPRIVFHGAQSKQAIGVYATNFHQRFDTMGYVQHYPQKRIITTRGSHYNGNNAMPNGVNVIAAIATYTGFNQEDGVIINKTSVERGLFHVTAYKTMSATEKTLGPKDRLLFANPVHLRDAGEQVEGVQHANYQLLDAHGIVKEESYIPRGQEAVVLGMVREHSDVQEERKGVFMESTIHKTYHDASLVTDVHHYGKVDKVFVGTQTPSATTRLAKVRFRKVRKPELGNKVCSAHGQKGVVGMIIPEQDMPYTKDGIVPDIIINPHAFPSRMTIGHLVETVFAKLCALQGSYGDGTVFLPFDQEEVYDRLEPLGFDRHGNEIMYNGRTGQQIATEIFIGPIFYYCLKHMVVDKVHARGNGPKVLLTHQPTSGRSKSGGLRIGEMERDVLLSHGLAQFAKECMMEKSDKYTWAVCRHCGTLAKYAPKHGLFECTGCHSHDLSVVQTPYAFKLLVQELEGMGIQMRLSHQAPPIVEETWQEEEVDDVEARGVMFGGMTLPYEEGAGEDADEAGEEEGYGLEVEHGEDEENGDEAGYGLEVEHGEDEENGDEAGYGLEVEHGEDEAVAAEEPGDGDGRGVEEDDEGEAVHPIYAGPSEEPEEIQEQPEAALDSSNQDGGDVKTIIIQDSKMNTSRVSQLQEEDDDFFTE